MKVLIFALAALLAIKTSYAVIICPTYVIQSGDSLFSISQKFDILVDDLTNAIKACGQVPALIQIGQEICLPGSEKPGCSNVESYNNENTCKVYVVQKGDTINSVAKSLGIGSQELQNLNADVISGGTLTPKQYLKLPTWSQSCGEPPKPPSPSPKPVPAPISPPLPVPSPPSTPLLLSPPPPKAISPPPSLPPALPVPVPAPVLETFPPPPVSTNSTATNSTKSSNAGFIAGVTIGCVAAVGVVIAGGFLFVRRKRNNTPAEEPDSDPESNFPPTKPTTASVTDSALQSQPSTPLVDPMLQFISSRTAALDSARDTPSNLSSFQFNFDELTVKKRLGVGSFGQVYLATLHETPIAVKVLIDAKAASSIASSPKELASVHSAPGIVAEAAPKALLEEVSIMASLRHPNVVQFLGFCLSPPCLAIEYCPRGSIYDIFVAAEKDSNLMKELTWEKRINMAIGTATGMLHLHSRTPQVLHRDLKSPNVLVATDWTVKVSDFNLSRIVEDAMKGPFSKASTAGGASNPRWLAPEQFENQKATVATDVFSFGIVMWELLNMKLPWMDVNSFVIPTKVLSGQRPAVPAVPAVLPGQPVPPALLANYVALMNKCWAQEPATRPGFKEIVVALRECQ